MIEFFADQGNALLVAIGEHIVLSLISLGLGILVAVPLGILLSQVPKIANVVIGIAGILQTVPTLALLALMVPFLGVGKVPSIVALFIYSLLPILRNAYLGMSGVDPTLLDAAKGMGMSKGQVIQKVQLPISHSSNNGRNTFISGLCDCLDDNRCLYRRGRPWRIYLQWSTNLPTRFDFRRHNPSNYYSDID